MLAGQPRYRFFDVNLRKDAYTSETVLLELEAATIVKLNDEEWEEVRQIAGIDAPTAFIERFDLDCLAITYGAEGAWPHYVESALEKRLDPVSVVDAVSAGAAVVQHPGAHLEFWPRSKEL